MADQVNYKIDVEIAGELSFPPLERSLTVEGYAKMGADIEKKKEDGGATTKSLDPLPGAAGSEIGFLMVTSSVYDEGLTIAQDGSSKVVLSEPLVLFGKQAVKHLGIQDKELTLKNNTKKNATVEVVVGYDAVSDS
jgi:hypothetical protein